MPTSFDGSAYFESWNADVSDSCKEAAEQSLAADGAIAFFSSSLVPRGLDADRAPQLKAIYKASQEKKERTHPRGAEWFLFLHLTAPSSVFQ